MLGKLTFRRKFLTKEKTLSSSRFTLFFGAEAPYGGPPNNKKRLPGSSFLRSSHFEVVSHSLTSCRINLTCFSKMLLGVSIAKQFLTQRLATCRPQ